MTEAVPDVRSETIANIVGSSQEPLVVATLGSVRLLILNRPAVRNAMSAVVREGYIRHMQEADADPSITCVIVTGAHGYFSAGVDIKERPPEKMATLPRVRPNPVEVCRAMTKPVIAMIDGPCVTGGLELALGCTFLVGSTRSSYVDTHIRIGIFPGWGLTSLLSAAIGARRAAQMQMTGEPINAQRAYEWGLVNELVPSERLLGRCLEIAAEISARQQHRIRRYVDLNRRIEGMQVDQALNAELAAVDRMRAGI